jgi:hypothetical protein
VNGPVPGGLSAGLHPAWTDAMESGQAGVGSLAPLWAHVAPLGSEHATARRGIAGDVQGGARGAGSSQGTDGTGLMCFGKRQAAAAVAWGRMS